MREVKFTEISEKMLEQLMKGAFLNVKDNNGNLNTMTIAWGALGYMWRKPVFIAMVRKSRHTFEMIENSEDFTVSFPLNDQLKQELGFCGTKSGRDFDKFKECNLQEQAPQKVKTPLINQCDLQLECKIVYKQPLEPNCMTQEIKDVYGAEADYHTMYYGEILACYLNEE